jgi:hypothetical protein
MDGGSECRKDATYLQNNTNTEQTHTDIHASSGIRTHDPSVRESEDGSCRRRRDHSIRLLDTLHRLNKLRMASTFGRSSGNAVVLYVWCKVKGKVLPVLN